MAKPPHCLMNGPVEQKRFTTNTVTLNPSDVQPDDVVVCTASATDGYGDIEQFRDSYRRNTAPVVSTVVITPQAQSKPTRP